MSHDGAQSAHPPSSIRMTGFVYAVGMTEHFSGISSIGVQHLNKQTKYEDDILSATTVYEFGKCEQEKEKAVRKKHNKVRGCLHKILHATEMKFPRTLFSTAF